MNNKPEQDMHREVQRYYGETLESSEDLKTTACCTAAAPPDYARQALSGVHPEVLERYYGCGLVLPEALEGLTVLDLGCGAGRDVYILSKLVGPEGRVVGVDMTPEQLDVARRHQDWHSNAWGHSKSNVDFIEANIEKLDEAGLDDGSFDLLVSNCVINLALDKAAVLKSAARLLRSGGELYFSDIYADRRIPAELGRDPVLYGECLSGALYWADFEYLAQQCGFSRPLLVDHSTVDVTDPGLRERLGDIRFRSVTCRLFCLDGLEPREEAYGQAVAYRGSIAECPDSFALEMKQKFAVGEPVSVSGNTALILSKTRFSDHFEHFGDNKIHYGAFNAFLDEDIFGGAGQSPETGSCC